MARGSLGLSPFEMLLKELSNPNDARMRAQALNDAFIDVEHEVKRLTKKKSKVGVRNPLLAIYKQRKPRHFFSDNQLRRFATNRFSWAIPTLQALKVIESYAPILEIGAGTGYWAALLRARGVDILAYDKNPPSYNNHPDKDNYWHRKTSVFTKVVKGDETVTAKHRRRTLFLCWPPYENPMAYNAARLYKGKHIIFVGESADGCTGDEKFHSYLAEKFEMVRIVKIPQWQALHDYMFIWRRK